MRQLFLLCICISLFITSLFFFPQQVNAYLTDCNDGIVGTLSGDCNTVSLNKPNCPGGNTGDECCRTLLATQKFQGSFPQDTQVACVNACFSSQQNWCERNPQSSRVCDSNTAASCVNPSSTQPGFCCRYTLGTQLPGSAFSFNPSSFNAGGSTVVQGWLTNTSGVGVANKTISLQCLKNSNWTSVASWKSGNLATSTTWTPDSSWSGNVSCRLFFAGDSSYASSTSPTKTVTITTTALTPTTAPTAGPTPTPVSCSSYNSCSSCISDTRCGWGVNSSGSFCTDWNSACRPQGYTGWYWQSCSVNENSCGAPTPTPPPSLYSVSGRSWFDDNGDKKYIKFLTYS